MGEALLIKAVDGGLVASGGTGKELYYFTVNTTYTIPRTGNYRITCVGGGGGGNNHILPRNEYSLAFMAGGASGEYNSKIYTLAEGTSYEITVGDGGQKYNSQIDSNSTTNGGTSSFGTLLSALGGHHAYRGDGSKTKKGNEIQTVGGNIADNYFYLWCTPNGSGWNNNTSWYNLANELTYNTGRGAVLYINGANITNTPTVGYEETHYGAGGHAQTWCSNNTSVSNEYYDKLVYKGIINNCPMRNQTMGNAGVVIVEFIN